MDEKTLLRYCRVYRGEKNNPYENDISRPQEYLRFHVWGAEENAVKHYDDWEQEARPILTGVTDNAERVERVVFYVVRQKIRKMNDADPNTDYLGMYRKL